MKNIMGTAIDYLLQVGDLELKNGDFWESILCVEFNDSSTPMSPAGPAYTAIFLNWTERIVVEFKDIKSFCRDEKPTRNFIMKD